MRGKGHQSQIFSKRSILIVVLESSRTDHDCQVCGDSAKKAMLDKLFEQGYFSYGQYVCQSAQKSRNCTSPGKNIFLLQKYFQMCHCTGFKSFGNHHQGDSEVSIDLYERDRICIIEKKISMMTQCKLQPHPKVGGDIRGG